jgi:hypothetical protein
MVYALTGRYYDTKTKKVHGHKYKGYFWRLKGSQALPNNMTLNKKPWVASLPMDKFAVKLLSKKCDDVKQKGSSRVILDQPVEKLDCDSARVI